MTNRDQVAREVLTELVETVRRLAGAVDDWRHLGPTTDNSDSIDRVVSRIEALSARVKGGDVLSLDGKAVGATASTGAGSTPATFAGIHLFVRGQEYAHKGGMWCWGEFTDEDAPNSSATPDRWWACDGMTHDLLDALAAARAEVEKLTRDRDGWERRTKEIGAVVIRAWALLRDWWQYAQLEEREEPFVDALTRALAADAEHDAYALAEIRRWRDVAGEAARLRGVLEEVREQLKYTGVSSALLPMVESALAAQEGL